MPWGFVLVVSGAVVMTGYAIYTRPVPVLSYLAAIGGVFLLDRLLRRRWARKHRRPPPRWF